LAEFYQIDINGHYSLSCVERQQMWNGKYDDIINEDDNRIYSWLSCFRLWNLSELRKRTKGLGVEYYFKYYDEMNLMRGGRFLPDTMIMVKAFPNNVLFANAIKYCSSMNHINYSNLNPMQIDNLITIHFHGELGRTFKPWVIRFPEKMNTLVEMQEYMFFTNQPEPRLLQMEYLKEFPSCVEIIKHINEKWWYYAKFSPFYSEIAAYADGAYALYKREIPVIVRYFVRLNQENQRKKTCQIPSLNYNMYYDANTLVWQQSHDRCCRITYSDGIDSVSELDSNAPYSGAYLSFIKPLTRGKSYILQFKVKVEGNHYFPLMITNIITPQKQTLTAIKPGRWVADVIKFEPEYDGFNELVIPGNIIKRSIIHFDYVRIFEASENK